MIVNGEHRTVAEIIGKFAAMLIFLDIDGVMVPARGWKAPELLDDGFPAFSGRATGALQSLTGNDTTIVLTTSHKSNYTMDEWKNIFSKRGINAARLLSLEKNVNNLTRKDEIERCFKVNDTNENFVIIDDYKSLSALPDFLKQHLILTSPFIGLTEEHLEHATNIVAIGLQTA